MFKNFSTILFIRDKEYFYEYFYVNVSPGNPLDEFFLIILSVRGTVAIRGLKSRILAGLAVFHLFLSSFSPYY